MQLRRISGEGALGRPLPTPGTVLSRVLRGPRLSAVALTLSALVFLNAGLQILERDEPPSIPPAPTSMSFDALQRAVDFPVLEAAYLPSGCELKAQYVLPQTGGVFRAFACLGMALAKGDDLHVADMFRAEDALVVGRPARFFDGIWMRTGPRESDREWSTDYPQLRFAHDGVVVHLLSFTPLTREELFRVAESMS